MRCASVFLFSLLHCFFFQFFFFYPEYPVVDLLFKTDFLKHAAAAADNVDLGRYMIIMHVELIEYNITTYINNNLSNFVFKNLLSFWIFFFFNIKKFKPRFKIALYCMYRVWTVFLSPSIYIICTTLKTYTLYNYIYIL